MNRKFYCLLALISVPAAAKRVGLNSVSHGVSIGAGNYQRWIDTQNKFDPVPGLAATGTTITGSDTGLLIPTKVGYFKNKALYSTEFYARYMLSTRIPWTSAGVNGDGYITYGSYGFGATLGVPIEADTWFRLNFILNAEMVFQRAGLEWIATGSGTAQRLKMSATSYLAGGGLQPEIWIGDMWALSLLLMYQYGFKQHWSVSQGGVFLARNIPTGEVTDSAGEKVPAQFGGFLGEATLKLHFQ